MELVYMDDKKEPYTLSSIVAECTGLTIKRRKEMNFKEFKTWLDDAVSMAEAMALPENKAVLDELIENTANNLAFIAELVESRQLIYKKPRHED